MCEFSYGEKGQTIIFDILFRHFRALDIGAKSIWGLPFMEFIYNVLAPEAAVRLIEDDLGLDNSVAADRNKALKVKDESTEYGNMQNQLSDQ